MAKSSKTKVTRISATDTNNVKKPKNTTKTKKPTKPAKVSKAKKAVSTNSSTVLSPVMGPSKRNPKLNEDRVKNESKSTKNPLKAFWIYVKGAWYELSQVRWPDRANTWSMTGALLAFTAFFLLVIILLDALFKYIFQIILGA